MGAERAVATPLSMAIAGVVLAALGSELLVLAAASLPHCSCLLFELDYPLFLGVL